MQGELAFSGKLINEFSKTGQDGPVKMNNELSIKFDGSILQSTGEEDGESRSVFTTMQNWLVKTTWMILKMLAASWIT